MNAVPITLKVANAFVFARHRHNSPTVGCKFAIGCEVEGCLVGVAIAGRPIARKLDNGKTLEILRVCTDGTYNACSFLYGRVARIARMMGYDRILTYTLDKESGASLRAVGARETGRVEGRQWSCKTRPRKPQDVFDEMKIRWEL